MKNGRRIILLLVSLFMISTMFVFAEPLQAEQEGYFTYELVNGEAQITCYTGTESVVNIPSILGGAPVTSILSLASETYHTLITDIFIPSTVRTFYFLPVSDMRSNAFLNRITVDPNNQWYKDIDGALYNKSGTTLLACPKGVSSFEIPHTVKSIGDFAFIFCKSLTTIVIPENVTSIGKESFGYCKALTNITIEGQITNISDSAFCYSGITNINFWPPTITTIGDDVFHGCFGLTDLSIPQGVTRIGAGAFYECQGLTSVNIPQSVNTICDQAFGGDWSSTASFKFNSAKTVIIDERERFPWISYYYTIPQGAKIIGYDPSTAKDYATKFGITFDVMGTPPNNYPIIIIPGIMGSELYSDENCTQLEWAPDGLDSTLFQVGQHISIDKTLYVRPGENQNFINAFREYGAQDTYKNLVDRLCDKFPGRAIYFFSYDFRQSNVTSANKLKVLIDSLNTDKVDIICHSMGGIVANQYAANVNNIGKINKIITLGTPYEGSPMTYNAVFKSSIVGDWINDFFLSFSLIGGLGRDVITQFSGMAELTPNQRYFNTTPFYNGVTIETDGEFYYIGKQIDYDNYVSFNNSIFGQTSYSFVRAFQDRLTRGADTLYNSDKSYYAVGAEIRTIQSVKFLDDGKNVYNFVFDNNGDGTVPINSASRLGELESLRGVGRYTDFEGVKHGDLPKNDDVIDWVIQRLTGSLGQIDTSSAKGHSYIDLTVACPVEVTITKGNSKLSSDPNNLVTISDFGELYLLGENSEIKQFAMDEGSDYDIVCTGTGSGTMDYSIRYYDENNNLDDERVFEDIPITPQTVITTGIDNSGEIILSIDSNNDGQEDTAWIATGTNSTGVQVDRIPPILSLPNDITVFATSPLGAQVYFSSTATDLADGVIPVNCSSVTGSVFPIGTSVVACSAIDTKGNIATGSFKVTVKYNCTGFFQPIDMGSNVINIVKAGSSIPIKFSLKGNMGLNVLMAGYPKAIDGRTNQLATFDDIETIANSNDSGLSYDAQLDQYTYVWKTEKTWATLNKQLLVKLIDGTVVTANFKFK